MNKMLLLAIIAISHIQSSQCVQSIPGQPVPHADVLDELLSKYLGNNYSNSALFDYMMGKPGQDANLTSDNIDISILDVDTVKKMINIAKQKYYNGSRAGEIARRNYNPFPEDEAYAWHPYVVNKTFDLMKHSIYMTQEKINQTRPWREKYGRHFGYQIAILYGASTVTLGKMEALLARMKTFKGAHFYWYLVIYERILACSIDISDAIEKIFMVQDNYEQIRGPRLRGNINQGQSQKDIQNLMSNPELLGEMRKNGSGTIKNYGPS